MTTVACSPSLSQRIIERVEQRMGKERLRRFLSGPDGIEIGDEEIAVEAPNAFAAEWIQRRFGEALRRAASAETGRDMTSLHVRINANRDQSAPTMNTSPAAPVHRAAPPERPARRRSRSAPALHSLDTFVVGTCNQLAYKAALRLTEGQRTEGFNTLFVHGECGVGKTHLLQGAAERFQRDNPGARALYTTGEAFTNAFITAVRSNDIASFRRRHRNVDLLCIDDVHFLSNKSATQSEFLYTFDAIGLEGARIMLASDEHPSRIRQFSRELVSRFSAGMVVSLDLPDPATRRRIVASLSQRRAMSLSEDAITVVSDRCQGSIRELEGALTRIDAVHRLLHENASPNGALDAASVRLALGPDHRDRPRKPVKVELIAECVSESLGVTMPELLGKSRHKRVVLARSMTAHLARTMTSLSFPEIAMAMGRPNHSTIVTACKRVERKIEQREQCEADLELDVQTWGELADELRRRVLRSLGAR